jgi:hypothetical protein
MEMGGIFLSPYPRIEQSFGLTPLFPSETWRKPGAKKTLTI